MSTRRFARSALLLALSLLAGCQSVAAPVAPALAEEFVALNAAETRYARDTGRAVYRGRPFQLTRGFVFADADRGFGLCLRSSLRDGRQDHTLLVLQRRIQGAVSQVEDDAQIVRAAAGVMICRDRSDWIDVR